MTPERPEPVDAAEAFVRERFPRCRWAILSGSVITAARTPGSDLDIVLMQDGGTAHRESLRFRGWPVELFAQTEGHLRHFLDQDLTARRPSLHRMIATGRILRDTDGEGAATQRDCAEVLAAGPRPFSAEELDRQRYGVTDLLDDARSAVDPAERLVIGSTLWRATATLFLDVRGHWRGEGKWLWRELRDCDPAWAARWLAARDDVDSACVIAEEVLTASGGPLFDGFRQDAPPLGG